MGDPRGPDGSATIDTAQRLVYWAVGILIAVVSLARLPVSRAEPADAAAPAAHADPPPAASEAAVPAPAPPEGSRFVTSCLSRAVHPECCDGWRLLDEYRRLYEPLPDDTAVPVGGPHVRFRHLVATVPDPAESGHGDLFDGVLEGVEEAVAQGVGSVSYVRDRSFLPWAEKDDAKRALRCWETEPGVVLYRPSADVVVDESAVVVLLVGETPTWGLRAPQLETALRLVQEADAYPKGTSEIDLLGPTFSGTAASLAATVRKHLARERAQGRFETKFSIVSGSATSPGVAPTVVGNEGGSITYASTTPSDSRLLDAMLAYICTRGGKCGSSWDSNVVLLTESLTAYGSGEAWKAESASVSRSFVEIKFPPNLAAIRRAYRAAPQQEGAAVPQVRAPLVHQSSGKGDGSEFSGDTPVAHDLALGEILRELSRSRVRFVGIVATDARDVLFLAERIRAQVPDIRLFALGSDIRYLHPDYSSITDGMLIAHAAPMDDQLRSTSLQSELVESVFLAGRRLLAQETATPRVRVSLIGHGALWQMSDDLPKRAGSSGANATAHAPMSWVFTFAFCGAAFLVVLGLVMAPVVGRLPRVERLLDPQRSNGFLRHRGFLWGLVGTCEHADLERDDRAVTAALLSIAAGPTLLFEVASFARTSGSTGVNSALCVTGAAMLVVATWLPVLRAEKRPTASTIVLCGAATTGTVLALGLGCGPQREATFNLLSGGSPVLAGLVGFGIFGVGLWCWRVRLRLLDSHRFGAVAGADFEAMKPPIAQALGESEDGSGTGLAEVERRLMRILRSPWLVFSVVPVIVHVTLLASVAIVFIKPPHTFEEEPRNTLLILFGLLSLLPITGNFSRLVAAWIALTRLLHRLAPLGVAAGLKRLPGRLARRLDAQLTISTSEIADLAYVVRALGAIPSLEAEHAQCLALLEAEQRYEAGAPDPSRSVLPDSTNRAELVDRLLTISGDAVKTMAGLDAAAREKVDDFVATLIAVFIPRYLRHFSLFILPLVVGSVLTVLMASLYFVQPQRLITSLVFVWVAGMIVSVFLIYVRLDRDPLVSAMGGTTAGSVTWSWGLVRRVAAWGVLPLGSMLAAQYPEVSTWAASIFEVIAKGFR